MTGLLISGPAPVRVILAHGAGAPMDSDFMNRVADGLAARGIGVVRFEFPYMAERRETGKKRPPNRQPELLQCWRETVAQIGEPQSLVLAGKSMGGRMASLIADEVGAAGLICLGYPFHPPGKPEKTRVDHLSALQAPTLMVQGTRDSLGNREEVGSYQLSPAVELLWLEDGDHDLKPRVRSGFTHAEHLSVAVDAMAAFIEAHLGLSSSSAQGYPHSGDCVPMRSLSDRCS